MPRARRPRLRMDMRPLSAVDPFGLELFQNPPDSGDYFVKPRTGAGEQLPLEMAGLAVVGAAHALFSLSARWLSSSHEPDSPDLVPPDSGPPLAEMRTVLRRREARLLSALLRRHRKRLEHAPAWMSDLQVSLDEIDEFLRWEDA